MNDRYRIRAGVKADVARILALDRATELLPHWPEAEYAAAVSSCGCGASQRAVQRCVFVAEAHLEIVGFGVVRVAVLPNGVLAELESVAVAASARRSGIGRALCEPVIEWSRRQGAREIDLEVRSGSQGAIALYQKLGFTVIGRRGEYYRDPLDDAILMQILL